MVGRERLLLMTGVLVVASSCGNAGPEEAAPAAGATAIPVAPPNASGATFPGQASPTYPSMPDPQDMPKIPVDPFDPGPLAPPTPSGKPKGTTL